MADDAASTGNTETPSGARTAGELSEVADSLRSRVDLFGKTLAAVATLGTTAVGLNKVGDLFPADDNAAWVAAACVGLFCAGLAAIAIAVRLMKVAGPVFMQADLEDAGDLDPAERELVRPVFRAAAKRFGYTSLVGLEERERSLRKAATRMTAEAERTRRTALADEVKAEIDHALAQGQVAVIRQRAIRAVSGRRAWLWYAAVIAGLIVFALGTDKVSSGRVSPADAKACGEARKASATATELGRAKNVCDAAAEEKASAPKPPSRPEARTQVGQTLMDALEACTKLVKKEGDAKSGPLEDADCNPVREAASAFTAPSP